VIGSLVNMVDKFLWGIGTYAMMHPD